MLAQVGQQLHTTQIQPQLTMDRVQHLEAQLQGVELQPQIKLQELVAVAET
jgi:hypothetical protein